MIGAEVRDYDSSSFRPLTVVVPRNRPVSESFLGLSTVQRTASSPLTAEVCGSCGLTEIRAVDAAELWRAYSGDT